MPSTDETRGVLVSGDREFRLPRESESLESFALETAAYTIDCSSGDRERSEWRGIPLGDLLERTTPAADATHLLVTGADGYRICLPLVDTLEALLAVERCDRPDDGSIPRFIGPGVEGTRSVKRVERLETVALAPGENPSEYEALPELDS